MLTLEPKPALEAALQAEAIRRGVEVPDLALQILEAGLEAAPTSPDEIVSYYVESLAAQGDFTASTRFQEDIHEYSLEELAAMERGEFRRPLQ